MVEFTSALEFTFSSQRCNISLKLVIRQIRFGLPFARTLHLVFYMFVFCQLCSLNFC